MRTTVKQRFAKSEHLSIIIAGLFLILFNFSAQTAEAAVPTYSLDGPIEINLIDVDHGTYAQFNLRNDTLDDIIYFSFDIDDPGAGSDQRMEAVPMFDPSTFLIDPYGTKFRVDENQDGQLDSSETSTSLPTPNDQARIEDGNRVGVAPGSTVLFVIFYETPANIDTDEVLKITPMDINGTEIDDNDYLVAPLNWCLLTTNPNPPHYRFLSSKRNDGLAYVNEIWSQAHIAFRANSDIYNVTDPELATGDPDDIVTTYDEDTEVRDTCVDEVGEEAYESLTAIVVRQIVKATDGSSSGTLGSSHYTVSDSGYLLDKAIVRDPDDYNNFVRTDDFTDLYNGTTANDAPGSSSFVRSMAHELGHSLLIEHPDPQVTGRLMSQTGKTSGLRISTDEAAHARRAINEYLSGAKKRDRYAGNYFGNKPISITSSDLKFDVSRQWVDINQFVAVKKSNYKLSLSLQLQGLIKGNVNGLKYVFMIDADNNPATGGVPSVGFSHSMSGIDLYSEVLVNASNDVKTINKNVYKFANGSFNSLDDPAIRALVNTALDDNDTTSAGDIIHEPVYDVVNFLIPEYTLPVTLQNGYRVAGFAYDPNGGGVLDTAPVIKGSTIQHNIVSNVSLNPARGPIGTNVSLNGNSFTPNATFEIYIGATFVKKASTDGTGKFSTLITMPPLSPTSYSKSLIDSKNVSTITVVDEKGFGDAVMFTIDDQLEGSAATPTGKNVNIIPIASTDITFSSVDSEGITIIKLGNNTHGEPGAFRLFGQLYTITTTAAFSGPITVCFKYDQGTPQNENGVRLFHYDNGQWVDITTLVDTVNNIVCGTSSHFSDFMMGEPSQLPSTGWDRIPTLILGMSLVLFSVVQILLKRRNRKII